LDINVCDDQVEYNGYIYHLTDVKIAYRYPCYIAATHKQNVELIEVDD